MTENNSEPTRGESGVGAGSAKKYLFSNLRSFLLPERQATSRILSNPYRKEEAKTVDTGGGKKEGNGE
jgi:hypothetical protein